MANNNCIIEDFNSMSIAINDDIRDRWTIYSTARAGTSSASYIVSWLHEICLTMKNDDRNDLMYWYCCQHRQSRQNNKTHEHLYLYKHTWNSNVRHVYMFMPAKENGIIVLVDDKGHTERTVEQDYEQPRYF